MHKCLLRLASAFIHLTLNSDNGKHVFPLPVTMPTYVTLPSA